MKKRENFLRVFKKAEKKYGKSTKRLAGEGWSSSWKTLIVTIMSAQSRDETIIPIAEKLFERYNSLENLANAKYNDVMKIFSGLNYNKTKAKHVVAAAQMLIRDFKGKVPDNIENLIKIPGVGRKTANLVLGEVYDKDSITIDTHCHRLLNVLGIVKTKTPYKTELKMMKIAPKRYWSRINRIFVLWGKETRGRDKNKILSKLK